MSEKLPDEPVALASATSRISVGGYGYRDTPPARPTEEDMKKVQKEEADKAKYKIEIMFHPTKRSSLAHKPFPVALTIWESGKRLHGGGDEKMYWCGYESCGMPIPSSDFAYMHVVCRHCKREMFLDDDAKARHIKDAKKRGADYEGIERMPFVVDSKLVNLTPQNLAELIVKTWYQLEGNADVYFKYTTRKIRYDKLHETQSDRKNLEFTREARVPGIYTLKRIREDVAAGSDLKNRFLAMIVA